MHATRVTADGSPLVTVPRHCNEIWDLGSGMMCFALCLSSACDPLTWPGHQTIHPPSTHAAQGPEQRFRITGLKPNTEYILCVKAIYDDGSFLWSESKAYMTKL